jgi:rod shape determining protein RodA
MRRTAPIIQRIDWLTVGIVVILMFMGLFNIASATSGADAVEWFDWGGKQGKQIIWVVTALLLAAMILVVEGEFFIRTSIINYGVNLLLLLAVLAVGRTIGGAKSWFTFGSVGIQPSEFSKTGTALMLAWLLSRSTERISNRNNLVKALLVVALPAGLILLQPDAGTVLVFGGLIFVFYREGLSGNVLIAVFCALLITIATILTGASTSAYPFIGDHSAIGWFWLVLSGLGSVVWFMIPMWVLPRKRKRVRRGVLFSFIAGLAFSASLNVGLENVLKPHQKDRIYVLFGIDVGNPDADYNIRHAKAAISSGGLTGKGYLQGPMTAYGFVPEQETDFIFCTVGEEWGFIGSSVVLFLFFLLLARILMLAERQRSDFTRIYAYAVASILFMHVLINIGMVLGLAPVIGIPLPFMSAGGSSLLGFTLLVFILLRLDAERFTVLR